MPISINVNVDLLDKKKLFKGKKGRYIDLILWETPESDFGDYLVKQKGEKNDRLPILGNGKYFDLKGKGATKTKSKEDDEDDGEDIF